MYYVIGNIYQEEGFTWIVSTIPDDVWKYSYHGEYETEKEAIDMSEKLNLKNK